MKIDITTVIVALITMAVVSLIGIVGLLQINNLVFQDLYGFGLVFSNRWAMPFWIYSGIIVGLSWVNIGAAVGLTFHVFRGRKPETEGKSQLVEAQSENHTQYRLADYFNLLEDKVNSGTSGLSNASVTFRWSQYNVRHPAFIVDSQC